MVAVVGINSIFGGTSALLLKQSPFIKCLKIFDPQCVEAAVDLSFINTQCSVKMFLGHDQLENAFQEVDIIVIGDESHDMVDVDSRLMAVTANFRRYAKAIARASPSAIIVVASTPINCLLPIMSQLLAKNGCYDHNKVVGSTTVDTVRASSLLAAHLNLDPKDVVLPVIGGSSEHTRVPVFSQSRPFFSLKKDVKTNLIMDIRRGDSLVLAHKGCPEALNRAYSIVRFLNSVMSGLRGDPNVTDITFCRTDVVPGVDYFSLPVIFGKDGVQKRFGVPKTSDTEEELVKEAIKHVKKDADKAAYIVKGAIELPEQKYLSPNDRATSQKEMFDLYVKCLQKPEDNKRDSMPDNVSQKSTDYSFKNLVADKSTIYSFDAPSNKSFRTMVPNKLKNVSSEDNFLKSSGFFSSPFQKPILILEPLVCPSSPPKLDKEFELNESERDMEIEENYILHEKNLARMNGNKKVNRDSGRSSEAKTTETRRSPLSSNYVSQMKTIDPIAKLKKTNVDAYQFNESNRRRSIPTPVEKTSANLDNTAKYRIECEESSGRNLELEVSNTKTSSTKSLINEPVVSNKNVDEDKVEHKKSGISESDSELCQNDTKNLVDNFMYDVRAEKPLYEIYNRRQNRNYASRKAPRESAVEDPDYYHPGNDEKYKRLVNRLFKQLDRLNEGALLPFKTQYPDRSSSPKCRQSFTESAVRSRSHCTIAARNDFFSPKTEFKIKLPEYEVREESGGNCFSKEQEVSRKTRISAPRIKPLLIRNRSENEKIIPKDAPVCGSKDCTEEVKSSKSVENKSEYVNFICPKCRNEVSCHAAKVETSHHCSVELQNDNSEEKGTELNAGEVSSHANHKSNEKNLKSSVSEVIYNANRIASTLKLPSKTLSDPKKAFEDTELQNERLRKLKEKINKKLIPLLHSSNGSDIGDRVKAPAVFKSELKNFDFSKTGRVSEFTVNERSNSSSPCSSQVHTFKGTPLVVEKNVKTFSGEKPTGLKEVRSGGTIGWDGVPFVVKQNENKEELKNKGRQNPDASTSSVENYLDKAKCAFATTVNTELSPEISCSKTAKVSQKIANKLQLLVSNAKLAIKLDGCRKVENTEVDDTEKCDKLTRLKREMGDLKVEEVRNYMKAKINDNFDRKMSLKISNSNIDSENISEPKPDSNKRTAKLVNLLIETNKKTFVADSFSEFLVQKPNAETSSDAKIENSAHIQVDSIAPKVGIPVTHEASDLKGNSDNVVVTCQPSEVNGKSAESIIVSESEKSEGTPGKDSNRSADALAAVVSADLVDSKANSVDNRIHSPSENKDSSVIAAKVIISKVMQSPVMTSNADNATKFNHVLDPLLKTYRSTNKLQLLARARQVEINDDSKMYSRRCKLQKVWERTLNPASNERKPSLNAAGIFISDGKRNKKSASVQIALKRIGLVKTVMHKPKLVPRVTASKSDGWTFPIKKSRKPTHNLLKELGSSRVHHARKAEKLSTKRILRRKVVEPLKEVRLCRDRENENTRCAEGNVVPRNSEYSRNERNLAKMALEVMAKRQLKPPKNFAYDSNIFPTDDSSVKNNIHNWIPSRPTMGLIKVSCNSCKPVERGSKWCKSIDVRSKMTSMPQIRHQLEHLELPLGPLEVQPGLASLNYGKIGSMFPSSSENSWEKVLFNEYVRSNLLPSLRDTRETFHIEEQPS